MRLVTVGMNKPSARVRGYLRRYLAEPMAGHFVGGCSARVGEAIASLLREEGAEGYMVWPAQSDGGFEIPYFHLADCRLVNADGLLLIERLKPTEADGG